MKPKKEAQSSERVFKATVRMLKPWSDFWIKRPTINDVLEAFADEIMRNGEMDKIFQVEIEEISPKVRGGPGRSRVRGS